MVCDIVSLQYQVCKDKLMFYCCNLLKACDMFIVLYLRLDVVRSGKDDDAEHT